MTLSCGMTFRNTIRRLLGWLLLTATAVFAAPTDPPVLVPTGKVYILYSLSS